MYDDKNSLGYKIRSIRLSNGIKQHEFADEFNVSRVYISDVERNIKIPNIHFLMAISKKYNVSIDWLVNKDYEKNKYIDTNNLDPNSLQAINTIIRKMTSNNEK